MKPGGSTYTPPDASHGGSWHPRFCTIASVQSHREEKRVEDTRCIESNERGLYSQPQYIRLGMRAKSVCVCHLGGWVFTFPFHRSVQKNGIRAVFPSPKLISPSGD